MGDDDQNIYAFNGASVEYIRRFEADYGASPVYLTDNYRSTGHVIAAANAVIEPARHRMKTGRPIQVNRVRRERGARRGVVWTGPGRTWSSSGFASWRRSYLTSPGGHGRTQAVVWS